MTLRYFVETPIAGDTALLGDAEAHHLAHVMRLKPGAEVMLFDGGGAEFTARVERVGKRDVTLAVLARHEIDRELSREVTLLTALPRGDRQKWLVEKAVELGVARLVPLRTERAVVQPEAGTCEKLRRAVIEASKQCRRNRLMQIGEPTTLAVAAAAVPTTTLRLLAEPGAAASLASFSAALAAEPTRAVAFLIGPEGGCSEDEASAARAAGWRGVSLGARILRVETAGGVCATWAGLNSA